MQPTTEGRVIDLTIRIGFLGLFIYGSLTLVAPLVGLVLWALILCVAVFPMHDLLTRWLGGRAKLSATLLTLAGLAITIGPVALMANSVIDFVQFVQNGLSDGSLKLPPPSEGLKEIPAVGEPLFSLWSQAHTNLQSVIAQHSATLLAAGQAIIGKIAGVGLGLLTMALSVIIMGVLLVTGPGLVGGTRKFAERVFEGNGGALVDMAGATVRNVSRGVIGVAAIQALLAGIVMALFGIELAGILSLGVLILGIIQVGPTIILVPVMIWAWTAMGSGQALLFTAIMLPVMLVDNVLKPLWMARGLETPMLVILIGVLGGLMSYGLVGIFVGPVILSVFHKLFTFWIDNDPADRPQQAGTDEG